MTSEADFHVYFYAGRPLPDFSVETCEADSTVRQFETVAKVSSFVEFLWYAVLEAAT